MQGVQSFRLDLFLIKLTCTLAVILLVYLITFKWLNGIDAMRRFNLLLYVGLEIILSFSIVAFIFTKNIFKYRIVKFIAYFLLGWLVDIVFTQTYYIISFYYQYGYISARNFEGLIHWDYYVLLLANLCWLQCLIFGGYFEFYRKYLQSNPAK